MATTVSCDICKKIIDESCQVMIGGAKYEVSVMAVSVPLGVRPADDICVRCLAKSIQAVREVAA